MLFGDDKLAARTNNMVDFCLLTFDPGVVVGIKPRLDRAMVKIFYVRTGGLRTLQQFLNAVIYV